MKKIILIGLFLISFRGSARAEVINGQLNDEILYDANSINVESDVDQGWHARSASLYDLSYNDIWSTGLMNQPGYWFGQIFTDNYATYGDGALSFKVTFIGRDDGAMFQYAIFGTDETNASSTALALNTDSNPTGSAWTTISSGAIATSRIRDYQVNFSMDEKFKYLGVRFRFTGNTGGDTAVDNISVIPEPAAIGLISLGGIVTLVTNRLKRKK